MNEKDYLAEANNTSSKDGMPIAELVTLAAVITTIVFLVLCKYGT